MSSTLVVTNSSIDGRGEWVQNCDDGTLVQRLGMVFDTVEDCLEFYKRYAVYVGFSIRNGPTGKNNVGKSWKWYVCSKEGFRRLAKMRKFALLQVKPCPKPKTALKGGN